MKKNIKNEKGAISLFVLLSMMFFLAFMFGAFSLVNRRNATQVEALTETQKIYSNKPTASEQYDSIFVPNSTSIVPVTNIDQLKRVKEVASGSAVYKYLINGKIYTYEKDANYVLQNDIILDFDETFNGKKDLQNDDKYLDYVLYNSTYNISLNGHSIYYQKKSDGSLWKLVCYQNAINSSTMFSTDSADTHYYGKSYLANRFSIIDNGITPYKHYWGKNASNEDQNYEFLLMYSKTDHTTVDGTTTYSGGNFDTSKNYNRWRQQNNPKDEYRGTGAGNLKAYGYGVDFEGASTLLSGADDDMFWGGITKSTTLTDCYLNGSVGHSYWYYAIGVKRYYRDFGIPTSKIYEGIYGIEAAKECLFFVRYK